MLPPHSEPATWPGYTSTPSPSAASRSSEPKRSCAPSRAAIARSGRAASPTKSESPVSTSLSSTTNAQCSGRWPGVCRTRISVAPARTTSPSASASHGYSASASEWIATGTPCSTREPAVARDVVGVGVRLEDALDPHVLLRRRLDVLLDRERRVDDHRDGCVTVSDEVRGAPEVVVDELAEDEHRALSLDPSGGGRWAKPHVDPDEQADEGQRARQRARRRSPLSRASGRRCRVWCS